MAHDILEYFFDRHGRCPRENAACPAPEMLAAYLDGMAAPRERGLLEEHFAGCPECRRALIDLRAILAAPEAPVPEGELQAIYALTGPALR